ncbi:hypothetical protein KAR91_68495 [Candidatus Pacearchaeota archaeon]|nr:hypothetical protein [Candidatus Pacearchaeota archaeon]
MAFTTKILCQNCKDWHIADKRDCPVRGCDWGFIYYEVDLARVPDKLMEDVVLPITNGEMKDGNHCNRLLP